MATVEERLAVLEHLLLTPDPLALTPPITIGSLTNVPAPGGQLAAQWAQDISTMGVHRFNNLAALKAWTPGFAAYAVNNADGTLWRWLSPNGWTMFTPWSGSAAGVALSGVTNGTVASLTIPADAGPRVATLSCVLQISVGNTASCRVFLAFAGSVVAEWFVPATAQIESTGGGMGWNVALHASGLALPVNTPTLCTVSVNASNTGIAVVAGPVKNRIDALVVPW